MENWERTATGRIIASSQKNVKRALREMGTELSYDEHAKCIIVDGKPLTDVVYCNHLRFTIGDRFGFRPAKGFFRDYLGYLARNPSAR
jgi:hypothetical protein